MVNPPMNLARLAAVDAAQAARVLSEVREATLAGQRARIAPRPVIEQSWGRMLRSGVDPDHDFRSGLLSADEVRRRREESPLRHVLPVLREGLLSVADVSQHIMVVADPEGRVLWREGSPQVLRKADGLGFELGADWREDVVGTNGVGTPAVVRRPVQVFAAEHFVRSHASWTCTGAPIADPRDGRLIGVVDVSGPLRTMHPATLSWVDSVAKLAEARLRELHQDSLERLRAVGAPVLARLDGPALVVDRHGWTAAVTGMPYVRRLGLPKSLSPGRRWLPPLGHCGVEPLAGGWLLRVADEPPPGAASRVRLDLTRAGPHLGHRVRGGRLLVPGSQSAPRRVAVPARRTPRRAGRGGPGGGPVRRSVQNGHGAGRDVQGPALPRGSAAAPAVPVPRGHRGRGAAARQPP